MTYHAKPQYHAEPPVTRIGEDGPNSMRLIDYGQPRQQEWTEDMATLADWRTLAGAEIGQIEDSGL